MSVVLTSVPPGVDHLELVLGQVVEDLQQGRTDVAITNLAFAVKVVTKARPRANVELLLRRIVAAGGGTA